VLPPQTKHLQNRWSKWQSVVPALGFLQFAFDESEFGLKGSGIPANVLPFQCDQLRGPEGRHRIDQRHRRLAQRQLLERLTHDLWWKNHASNRDPIALTHTGRCAAVARHPTLTANRISIDEFPTDAVGEDRRHDTLDPQLGTIGPLDLVEPLLKLHGPDARGNVTIPGGLDPVFDVGLVSFARRFCQTRQFVIEIVVDELPKRHRFQAQQVFVLVESKP
jgi:hypothetical protein